MEKLYDEIVLTKDVWRENINQKIGDIITTLLAEGECCKVYDDDCGIYIIQHNHDERIDPYGGPDLIWATSEEVEDLYARRDVSECESEEAWSENDENDENEPTFGTVSAEFYYEAGLILDAYQSTKISADDALSKLIDILDKSRSAIEYKVEK